MLHHADAGLPQQVHGHGIAAGQRAGMRAGRLLSGLGGARFVDHHRLHGGDVARHLEELAPVAKALHVERGHPGMLVLTEIAQVVVEADIALVARPDVGGKAHLAVVLSLQRQRQQHVARLGDDAHIAGLDVVQRQQIEPVVQVEHTGGVGADDAHAVGFGLGHHLTFQLGALAADLGEAAGEYHRPLDAAAAALGDQARHAGGRGTDQRQLGRAGNRGDGRPGLDAEDHVGLGIDGIDVAAKAILDQADHGLVAALGGIARGAHHGNAGGSQDGVQRTAYGEVSFDGVHVSHP